MKDIKTQTTAPSGRRVVPAWYMMIASTTQKNPYKIMGGVSKPCQRTSALVLVDRLSSTRHNHKMFTTAFHGF